MDPMAGMLMLSERTVHPNTRKENTHCQLFWPKMSMKQFHKFNLPVSPRSQFFKARADSTQHRDLCRSYPWWTAGPLRPATRSCWIGLALHVHSRKCHWVFFQWRKVQKIIKCSFSSPRSSKAMLDSQTCAFMAVISNGFARKWFPNTSQHCFGFLILLFPSWRAPILKPWRKPWTLVERWPKRMARRSARIILNIGTYPNSRDTTCRMHDLPTFTDMSSSQLSEHDWTWFTWFMTNQHPRNSLEVVASFNPFKHVLVNMAVLPKLGWTCRIKVLGESHVDFSNPTKPNGCPGHFFICHHTGARC